MIDQGQGYRVLKRVKRRDSEKNIYDLCEQFKQQVLFFPFGALVDLIDATSRLYDMEYVPPIIVDEADLVPEAFDD